MSIKAELGKKIRKLREERGLSRSELCEGEEELTVRQLARIEAGESLPTITKLEFIAMRLSVSVSLLVDKKYVELPKSYLQLKRRIYKFYTYREEMRIAKKKQLFTKVYEEYYDELPEEEQLSIDVQYAALEMYLTGSLSFSEGILGEYFSQILQKKEYSVNDLLIIELYFGSIHFKDYDETLFLTLFSRVTDQIDYSIDIEQFLLIKALIVSISVFLEFGNYDKIIDAVTAANKIMNVNQDFQKKPIIDMHEGKYYLFSQKDVPTAKQKFEEGAKLAELQGDSVISQKILKEWELDFAIFKQQDSSSNQRR
ncbi:helix-turn-helix domain-containing protein [Candidatus Enterococcus clewellii]|uniref:HTH cro/C1-type domain-containing protein n=2 Tax=Candidatus Enterococcus clewellii TaxID=1834193 RepID=A0AAQ3VW50_9ENTE